MDGTELDVQVPLLRLYIYSKGLYIYSKKKYIYSKISKIPMQHYFLLCLDVQTIQGKKNKYTSVIANLDDQIGLELDISYPEWTTKSNNAK